MRAQMLEAHIKGICHRWPPWDSFSSFTSGLAKFGAVGKSAPNGESPCRYPTQLTAWEGISFSPTAWTAWR